LPGPPVYGAIAIDPRGESLLIGSVCDRAGPSRRFFPRFLSHHLPWQLERGTVREQRPACPVLGSTIDKGLDDRGNGNLRRA